MPLTLQHNDLRIELADDGTGAGYDKTIRAPDDAPYEPAAQYGIRVYRGEALLASALLQACGGATSCTAGDGALADDGHLVVACCNKLFRLTLPELEPAWIVEADWATCFSVHRYADTYITHGEYAVARIDRSGTILWSYTGADIFVCLHEGNPFEMCADGIALTDFNGGRYFIGYDGNTIDYRSPGNDSRQAIAYEPEPKKPWWRFW